MGLSYFILIREYSIKYFIFMMLIPILTDTFAFAGGMMIGKHKVTKISPNKSGKVILSVQLWEHLL